MTQTHAFQAMTLHMHRLIRGMGANFPTQPLAAPATASPDAAAGEYVECPYDDDGEADPSFRPLDPAHILEILNDGARGTLLDRANDRIAALEPRALSNVHAKLAETKNRLRTGLQPALRLIWEGRDRSMPFGLNWLGSQIEDYTTGVGSDSDVSAILTDLHRSGVWDGKPIKRKTFTGWFEGKTVEDALGDRKSEHREKVELLRRLISMIHFDGDTEQERKDRLIVNLVQELEAPDFELDEIIAEEAQMVARSNLFRDGIDPNEIARWLDPYTVAELQRA